MDISEKIRLLDRYLSIETVNDSNEKETEIVQLIHEITDELIQSYEFQRDHIAHLLDVYERHNLKSLSYLLFVFQTLYSQFIKLKVVEPDLSLTEREVEDEKMMSLIGKVFTAFSKFGVKHVQLSDNFDLDLSDEEKKDYIRVVNFMVNRIADKDVISDDDIENILMNLSFVRNVLRSFNKEEIFYFFIGTFFDLLYKNENYQLSRDMAEACLMCGYKDNLEELAYFQSFKAYANTSSAIPALHYGICSLKYSLAKGVAFDYQIKNFVSGLVKFYRNIKLYQYAIDVFEKKPKTLVFSSYEEHSLTHTYFLTLLIVRSSILPLKLSEYLDKHREDIINGGEVEVLPWLNTLHMITYTYPDEVAGVSECKNYIEVFSRIVPPEKIKKYLDIATGSSIEDLISHLKSSLLNLASTRNEIDFTTDNSFARLIANSLIQKSFKESSPEGYLYSMIINSDYSLKFKTKQAAPIAEIKSAKPTFSGAYYFPKEIIEFIESKQGFSIVWLGTNGRDVLPVLYNDKKFTFCNNSRYRIEDLKKWFSDNIDSLPLENDKIIAGGLKAEKQSEDFKLEGKELSQTLSFSKIEEDGLKNILVVKDYELSVFPHNLLLDKHGEFYISKTPIMNVMSLEWLLEKNTSSVQEIENPTKGIWIPTAVGDFTLNYLYSYIEPTIKEHGFLEETELLPQKPLNNDINIIAAHGDQSINTFPALYPKGMTESFSIVNLNRVIGKGKILIFFVCHSGSMKADFLRNRISTMIRGYLKAGYEAVIAPFWALDISIAKYWLPEFMNSIEQGKTVMDAVHDGNMKVKEKFPTPKAYACLHVYGNPFFKIKSSNGNPPQPK